MKRMKLIIALLIVGLIFSAAISYGTTNAKEITGEQALSIALQHQGLQPDQVTGCEIEYERENGMNVYDIEFFCENVKYDLDIHAETGEVLDVETERHIPRPSDPAASDVTAPATEEPAGSISEAEALRIAMEHLKVSPDQLSMIDIEREMENGKKIYEVEFVLEGTEYEFDIDAISGRILEITTETYLGQSEDTTAFDDDDDDGDDDEDPDDDDDPDDDEDTDDHEDDDKD